ncbi:MAG: helix-turn-helix domain-containing protein [Acidimicrobiia bacterium]
MSITDLPDVLTVEEAAAVLRIGRNAAYDLARQWRVTRGREGLPNVVLGRSLRVPRAALERLLAATPLPESDSGLRLVEEGHNPSGWAHGGRT